MKPTRTTNATMVASTSSTQAIQPASAPNQNPPSKDPQVSPVMSLPVEVRQKIWKMVMIFDRPIPIEPHSRYSSAPSNRRTGKKVKPHVIEQKSHIFALPSTCRQSYLEATPIYYGMNTFTTTIDSMGFVDFLDAITAENANTITSLRWSPLPGALKGFGHIQYYRPIFSRLRNLKHLCIITPCRQHLVDSRRTLLLPRAMPQMRFSSSDLKKLLNLEPSTEIFFPHYVRSYCDGCDFFFRRLKNQLSGESDTLRCYSHTAIGP